ncbi:MAG: hypothetical protein IJZ53_07585 [Tyzzerella sp.]|nr:hypothetical protein [Tyzzerella sp.]
MVYEPYVSPDYYKNTFKGTSIPENELEKYLRQASRHIDTLTYNRIVGRGISNLTVFQQEIIKEVVCAQAEFEYENKEVFDMVLQGYAINGASMNFGGNSWNVKVEKGIPMRRDVYATLSQTGLCCRLAR